MVVMICHLILCLVFGIQRNNNMIFRVHDPVIGAVEHIFTFWGGGEQKP